MTDQFASLKMTSVNVNIAKMDTKIDVVEDKLLKVNYMCLDLDAKSRRQNIVLHGVCETDDDDPWIDLQKFMSDELGLTASEMYVQRVERVGRLRTTQGRGRDNV